jgi:hypothetical protein
MTSRTCFFASTVLMALSPFAQAKQELWVLDNLSHAGSRNITVEGHPHVISW